MKVENVKLDCPCDYCKAGMPWQEIMVKPDWTGEFFVHGRRVTKELIEIIRRYCPPRDPDIYEPLESRNPHLYRALADVDYARGYVEGMIETVDSAIAELVQIRKQNAELIATLATREDANSTRTP